MKKYCFLFCIIMTLTFFIDHAAAKETAELIPFYFKDKMGYLNSALQIVIKPQLINYMNHIGSPHFTKEGFAVIYFDRGDSRGAAIITADSKIIYRLEQGFINHIYGDLYHIDDWSKNQKTKQEIIRLADKEIIANQTQYTGTASEDGYILAEFFMEKKRYAFIDFEGNRVLQDLTMGKLSSSFFEQRAIICDENWQKRIIDMDGNTIGNIQFKYLGQKFSEGLTPAWSIDEQKGYINKHGEFEFLLINLFDNGWGNLKATNFSGGYAAVKIKEKHDVWRIINTRGEMLSKDIYVTEMNDFFNGLSLVKVFNKELKKYTSGYVDIRGEFLIMPILEYADDFRNGYARIKYNGQDGLLKTNGKVIWSSNIMKGNIIEDEIR